MSNEWYDIDSWQWVDNDNTQWGFSEVFISGAGLNQIWTDNKYVYVATTSGLDVINIETEQRQSFASNSYGYSTVWSDSNEVFVGTTAAGIKLLNQSSIGPLEIFPFLSIYAMSPFITSNNIKHIHGNSNKLICSTVEGIDIIRRDSQYITQTFVSGAQKCFVTPNFNYYYYTISGSTHWSLNRLNGNTMNWTTPDVVYTTGSGFLSDSTIIKDFYVTEHTSMSGLNNTIFIITDDGAHVYDEGTSDHIIYRIL